MFFWKNKKKVEKKEEEIPQEPSWKELTEKAKNIEFNFKFGKRNLKVSTNTFQKISLIIVVFSLGLLFNNILNFFFPGEAVPLPVQNKSLIDEKKITKEFLKEINEKETIEAAEKRFNKNKKKAAMDSLIDNKIFTKENIQKIENMYPDSLCGC